MVETRKATVAGAVGGACYWVLDKIVDYALPRIKPGELYGWLQWAASVMALVPDWVVGVFVAVCAVLSIWPGLIRRPSTGWTGLFGSDEGRRVTAASKAKGS